MAAEAYNNSYHKPIGMSPNKLLHGKIKVFELVKKYRFLKDIVIDHGRPTTPREKISKDTKTKLYRDPKNVRIFFKGVTMC